MSKLSTLLVLLFSTQPLSAQRSHVRRPDQTFLSTAASRPADRVERPPGNEPVGLALAFGVPRLDPSHYHGQISPRLLDAATNDAKTFANIARQHKLTAHIFVEDPTKKTFCIAIRQASSTLLPRDFCVISFSGHGAYVPDKNGDEARTTPNDVCDETWCFYDEQLLDDELKQLLGGFKKGVRVFVIADTCHSGTFIQELMAGSHAPTAADFRRLAGNTAGTRFEETLWIFQTYWENKAHYDEVAARVPPEDQVTVEASVFSIGACRDNEEAGVAGTYSIFTEEFTNVVDSGKSTDYLSFYESVCGRVTLRCSNQHPSKQDAGLNVQSFLHQIPYTIEPPAYQ